MVEWREKIRRIAKWALPVLILLWAGIYIAQKGAELNVVNYDGPTLTVKGAVVDVRYLGRKDWFDHAQTEIQLSDGKKYRVYTKKVPDLNQGDLVVLRIPADYSKDAKEIPAVSYELVERAPAKIKYN